MMPVVDIFATLGSEYEQIVFGHDAPTGLKVIIAVYSTALGPALGGTRFKAYASEEDALRDVLRLSKAMAHKASAAGLNLGGGKAVIIGDSVGDKTPDLLRAYGRIVEGLGGAYITTADVGTTSEDMAFIAETTRFVTGTPVASGDPSPMTAHGVWSGLRAVAEELWADASLRGRHVVVQGVGKVGSALSRLLSEEGAVLTLADVNEARVTSLAKELGATVVPPEEALFVPCAILSPCALGPVITDKTLPKLKCRAVAGAANNQLATPEHGARLEKTGILYAPDFVLNAGGLINVEDEMHGYDHERAKAKASAIAQTLRRVFERAKAEGISTAAAADAMAGERIRAAAR